MRESAHDAELEDLPPALVIRGGRRRIGASTTVAAVALVGLLAAGFGVLGGRPAPLPSPGASAAAGVDETPPAVSATSGPTPLVTPVEPCGPDPESAPGVSLDVDGVSTAAVQLAGSNGVAPPPDRVGQDIDPASAVEIPADATTELWTEGAACAVAWHIWLSGEDGSVIPLLSQSNPALDPGFASQNHFGISFRDARPPGVPLLEAGLNLANGSYVLAGWPVHFRPIDWPRAELRIVETGVTFPAIDGCDIVLTLRNGEERQRACDRDLSVLPGPSTKIDAGLHLALDLDGWSLTEVSVNCGSQADRVFTARPATGCPDGSLSSLGTVFPAPGAGDWTLAVAACAVGYTQFASNRICGTWYAAIDTR